MVLVDSNVLLDIVTNDPVWAPWSAAQIEKLAEDGRSIINGVVYAELSVRFPTTDAVDEVLRQVRLTLEATPLRPFPRRQGLSPISWRWRHQKRSAARFLHRSPRNR